VLRKFRACKMLRISSTRREKKKCTRTTKGKLNYEYNYLQLRNLKLNAKIKLNTEIWINNERGKNREICIN
jgi:hypothetical protein